MAKRCPKGCVPRKRAKAKKCKFGVSKTTGKCLKNKRAKRGGDQARGMRALMRQGGIF